MNPDYVDRLWPILHKRPRLAQLDRRRVHEAASDAEVFDVLVEAFGADAVHEATLEMERMWPTVFIERIASVRDPLYSHAERLHQILCTTHPQVRIADRRIDIRLREASMAAAINILLEAYGLEAVEEAEQKRAAIKQAVADKESELHAARLAKARRAHPLRSLLIRCSLPIYWRRWNGRIGRL